LKHLVNIIKYIIFLCIGIVIIYFILKEQDINKIIQEFKKANYWWIIATLIPAFLGHLFRGLRWNILINSIGYKTRKDVSFYSVMIGYLANMVVPRLGEVSRCGTYSKKANIPFDKLIGTVIAERGFDIICLIILTFLTIIFQINLLKDFLTKYIIPEGKLNIYYIVYVILFIIIIILLGFYSFKPLINFILKFNYGERIINIIKGIWTGIKSIIKLKENKKFILYTFLIWTMYFFTVYLCFYALEGTSFLSIIDGITILVISSIGIAAPVPGGIGTYHFLVSKGLHEIYGVPSDVAISYAFISHTSGMLIIIILGILSYYLLLTVKSRVNE